MVAGHNASNNGGLVCPRKIVLPVDSCAELKPAALVAVPFNKILREVCKFSLYAIFSPAIKRMLGNDR